MPPEINPVGVIVAALGGAAVGLERQWSGHADGAAARFAGIRTFTLLGTIGGMSGVLWSAGLSPLALVLLTGAAAVIVAAYVAGTRQDIDGTTEVAALVVVAAGVLAGIGAYRLASGVVAIETLLLAEKSRLHAAVRRIEDVELRAGVRFAVLALVVLPLLPVGPFGPFGGIRPRELWILTLFFSGLSFLGYIARRVVGAGRGDLVTGLLAGVVSSTNATFAFARLSGKQTRSTSALGYAAVAANAVLNPRVLIATAALNAPLVPPLARLLALPALVAVAVTAFGAWRSHDKGTPEPTPSNPLQLRSALRLAAFFQAVMMLVHVVRGRWGGTGVLGSAAVLGLSDVDALTTSMARSVAQTSLELAAAAIAIGVLSNTVMKFTIAVGLGRGRFRLIAGGTLAAMILVAGAVLTFFLMGHKELA